MKIEYKAANEMSDSAIHKATGKKWNEWYALLDKLGGPEKGRKVLNDFLFNKNKVDAWWTGTIVVEYEKARQVTEKDGRLKGYNICATKAVAAKPAQIFDAFTDTAKLSKWFGAGTKGDFKEGGSFSNPDGNQGTIKKINPGKGLRFTWDGAKHNGEIVEVKLAPSGAKCSVMVNHDRIQSREAADGLRAAWGQALETLKSQLEEK